MSDVNPDEQPERDDPTEVVPTFSQVVQAFALQALMACGQVANPATGQLEASPRMARYHIGVLEVLADKTEGNLEKDEQALLDACIHQARLAFFQLDDIMRDATDKPGH